MFAMLLSNPRAIVAPSATLAAVEAAAFNCLRKSGLRLLGAATMSRSSKGYARWPLQRMGPHRGTLQRDSRCALCAGEHRTDKRKCPVGGCSVGRDQACALPRPVAPNAGVPHAAQSNPKEKETRQAAKGWRPPGQAVFFLKPFPFSPIGVTFGSCRSGGLRFTGGALAAGSETYLQPPTVR